MKRIALAAAATLMFVGPLASTTAFADPPRQEYRGDHSRNDRNEWNDRSDRNWQPINQRQNMLENRIQAGIRSGRLNRHEAMYLRAEFRQIAQIEARYRRNGLNQAERRDLDRRFDRLTVELQVALNDRDRRRRG